jgi:alpha-1,2-mannosyltransferase
VRTPERPRARGEAAAGGNRSRVLQFPQPVLPPPERRRSTASPRLERAAALAWIAVAIAASIHAVVSPVRHNLWPVFREGALGWGAGAAIYDTANYFRYSPAFAVLLSPFAVLPSAVGNVLFDLCGLALLAVAIRRLVRVVFPAGLLSKNEPAVLLLALPGVVRSVWCSQAHTWSAALVFLAAAALVEERWWAAALALALAVHLKMAPIALAGVVAAAWPGAMGGRLLAAIVAFVPLPLLRGHPADAVALYARWFARLRILWSARFPSFRDLRHVFEATGVPIPTPGYRILQLLAGVAVLLWTRRLVRRGGSRACTVSGIFALTIVWMLVLGPAVEFVQFPLLAPWVGAALLAAWRRPKERLALGLIYLATTVAGFGAVEDALGRVIGSAAPEALVTVGTIGFGVWVCLAWSRHGNAPVARTV